MWSIKHVYVISILVIVESNLNLDQLTNSLYKTIYRHLKDTVKMKKLEKWIPHETLLLLLPEIKTGHLQEKIKLQETLQK